MNTNACSRNFPALDLAPAALLVLAASAGAQASGGHVITNPQIVPGPYTSIVAGDLDGDLSPEIAAVRDGSLIVYHDPDVNDLSTVVATGVLDVCYCPNANGNGHPGLLC